MKILRNFFLLLSFLIFSQKLMAQNDEPKLFYHLENGDTIYDYKLRTVWVYANRKFTNDVERYHYNQLRHNMKIVFPYVKEAGRVVNEVNATLPTLSHRERKKYLKTKEEELRLRFEEPLKNLNETQGKLLIQLINRETGNSVFKVLCEVKNPLKASMYEATAIVNGMNLKEDWDASKHQDEEQIMENLEREYGYASPVQN